MWALVVIGVKDNTFFTPKAYKAWNEMMTNLKSRKEIELVVSLNNLKKLVKNDSLEKFELVPLLDQKRTLDPNYLLQIKKQLFNDLPFYEGLLFNKKSGAVSPTLSPNATGSGGKMDSKQNIPTKNPKPIPVFVFIAVEFE
jgi:hypothetical protein